MEEYEATDKDKNQLDERLQKAPHRIDSHSDTWKLIYRSADEGRKQHQVNLE
jgi:hypothetical protein